MITPNPNVPQPANAQEISDALDAQVAAGTLTAQQALESAQASGLTTGPNGGYEVPGQAQAETDVLNEQSRQSAARSAAYQANRAGNPEGYTQASQDAWDSAHPLSEY